MSTYNPPTYQGNPAAAIPVYTVPFTGGSLGYAQETVLASGVSTLSPPAGARYAVISVAGEPVTYRDDGVAPTATVGMPIAVGSTITYAGNLAALQFISTTGTATLNITYYG